MAFFNKKKTEIKLMKSMGIEIDNIYNKNLEKLFPNPNDRYNIYLGGNEYINNIIELYRINNQLATLMVKKLIYFNNNDFVIIKEKPNIVLDIINEIDSIDINEMRKLISIVENYGKNAIKYYYNIDSNMLLNPNIIKLYNENDITLDDINNNKELIKSSIENQFLFSIMVNNFQYYINNADILKKIVPKTAILKKVLLKIFEDNNYNDEIIRMIADNFTNTVDTAIEEINLFDIILKSNKTDLESSFINCLKEEKDNKYFDTIGLFTKYIYYKYTGETSYEFSRLYNIDTNDTYITDFLQMFKEIENKTNIKDIINIEKKYNLEPSVEKFSKRVNKACLNELQKSIFKLPNNYKTVDGIKIIDDDIVDLSRFVMVTHGISNKRASINGEIGKSLLSNPQKWEDKNIKGSTVLSTRLFTDFSTGSGYTVARDLENSLTLGFCQLDDYFIFKTRGGDAVTDMEGNARIHHGDFGGRPILNIPNYFDAAKNNNETAFLREKITGEKILPDYLIAYENYDNKNNGISENAKKWALYYDIPIVVLDGKKIFKNAANRIKESMNKINNGIYTKELFEDMLHCCATMNDCKNNNDILSYGDILTIFLESCNTMEKYNVLQDIVENYPIEKIVSIEANKCPADIDRNDYEAKLKNIFDSQLNNLYAKFNPSKTK